MSVGQIDDDPSVGDVAVVGGVQSRCGIRPADQLIVPWAAAKRVAASPSVLR